MFFFKILSLHTGKFLVFLSYCILMLSRTKKIGYAVAGIILFFAFIFLIFTASFRRPCRKTVQKYAQMPSLAFSIIKAESGFSEDAVSSAGAVGLMQLMPSTAKFVCEQNNIPFNAEQLNDGEYNAMLGCIYLNYLQSRFEDTETVVAAYNAGEGIVSLWLKNTEYSDDGIHLKSIPYGETKNYVKKVLRYQKIYAIFD